MGVNSFVQLLAPESIEFVVSNFMKMVSGLEYEHHYEFWFVHASGKKRLCEKYMMHFVDKLGNKKLIINMLDVTERKQNQEEIQLNTYRLKVLVDILQYQSNSTQDYLDYALGLAIEITKSKIGYIFLYNEENQEFTLNSWSKDVMKECAVLEQQTVYQLEKTGLWGEAVRQRKSILVNDFQATNPLKKGMPEGHAKLYKYLTIPIFSDDKIVGVVAVANKETDYQEDDILQLSLFMNVVWKVVDRKNAETQIIKNNTELEQRVLDRTFQLEESNKELESFAYSVSHDLRAPLRHIDGFTKILKKTLKSESDDINHYFDVIINSSTKMANMIDNLLNFSRLGRKSLQILYHNLNLK